MTNYNQVDADDRVIIEKTGKKALKSSLAGFGIGIIANSLLRTVTFDRIFLMPITFRFCIRLLLFGLPICITGVDSYYSYQQVSLYLENKYTPRINSPIND